MNGLILGLYGVYLIAIAINGRSEDLLGELDNDMPGFIPWALAIVALVIMAQSEMTEKLVKPFVFLLILNFVLVNFGNISSEVLRLRAMANGSDNQ